MEQSLTQTPLFASSKLLLACFSLAACSGEAPAESTAEQTTAATYTYTQPNRDGTGKFYMGREIAHVMGHQGARWLQRPEREQEERTDLLLENLPLKPGDAIADIGAGNGYFTLPMADLVGPTGVVYGVDIQQEMLDKLERRAAKTELSNIRLVLATDKSPGLEPGSIDMALFVDAYHEFEWPLEVMTALFESLKPGGKVVLIEYRAEDPNVPILRLHKMTEQQVQAEMAAIGLKFVSNSTILPRQHFLIFERPAE